MKALAEAARVKRIVVFIVKLVVLVVYYDLNFVFVKFVTNCNALWTEK